MLSAKLTPAVFAESRPVFTRPMGTIVWTNFRWRSRFGDLSVKELSVSRSASGPKSSSGTTCARRGGDHGCSFWTGWVNRHSARSCAQSPRN